jgi:DNA adenine methylase
MATGTLGPLLKWAGGKRQLLPHIRRFYPDSFNRYIEPFFGSGAVFFDLHRSGRLENRKVFLIDSNADLIGCYTSVRDHADAVASALEELADGHRRGGHEHYYAVRNERFNPLRASRRQSDGAIAYTPELAAMLIYLNRTGFNGLFRVNARGHFNVPAGRYERPRIADRRRVLDVGRALRGRDVRLDRASFETVEQLAQPGDFLYIDPPYAPVSATANFRGYTSPPFDHEDQKRLQKLVVTLARRGCFVLLSNSTAAEITTLYETNAAANSAGLRSLRVQARRAVNRDANGRGLVEEYLITNIDQTPDNQTSSRQSGHA